MTLTDAKCRAEKPGASRRKLSDGQGLQFWVQPNGSKLWQLIYYFGGKQRQVSLGPYPEVTLSEARSRRDLAKTLLREGKDPALEWRQPAPEERIPGDTFKEVALEYIERRRRENLAVPTMIKKKWLLEFAYTSDDSVIDGEVEGGRRYTESDFNRIIEIAERERYRVKTFMAMIDRSQKTIVFCATQDHAAAVRDLINQMKMSTDPDYCVRVTANDGAEGETWLRTFQDNEKTIPTILTTSQKLSTGVDARNVRNIVLMRPVNSMIEFKQIVGRERVSMMGRTISRSMISLRHISISLIPNGMASPPSRLNLPSQEDHACWGRWTAPRTVHLSRRNHGLSVSKSSWRMAKSGRSSISVLRCFIAPTGAHYRQRNSSNGCLGSCRRYSRTRLSYESSGGDPSTRKALLDALNERGFGREPLAEIRRLIDAENSDLFDVLAYIAFALPTVTRADRVASRKAVILPRYDDKLQAFLDFVLSQYIERGVEELDQDKLAALMILKYRGLPDATNALGGDVMKIRAAFIGFQPVLYS